VLRDFFPFLARENLVNNAVILQTRNPEVPHPVRKAPYGVEVSARSAMAAAAKAADMTTGPTHAATESAMAEAARGTHMVHAVWIMTETTMAEATVIEPAMTMKTEVVPVMEKVMPVMEIAAIERIVIVPIAGVGAIGKIAVISIAAIVCAGRQAEAQTCKQHRRPRQPF
jgi:hypothetical protein